MDLMDLYVSEVGRRLPHKTRADIEAEIRSALRDLLDERSRSAGKPIDDEMMFAVMKEYGYPEKVAASYVEDRYLIGPQLYPTFIKVLFAVLPITIILALISLGFSVSIFSTSAQDVLQLIGQIVGSLLWSAIITIGSLTLIFMIIERTVPEFKLKKREWDPHSLLKIKPPERLGTGSLVADIVFTGLAILVFNFSPGAFSIGYESSGAWWVCFICTSTQTVWRSTVLSAAFFRYLPALDFLWTASIVLNVLLLSRGRWQGWTRWVQVGLKTLAAGLAVAMLAGPSLIGVTAASLNAVGFPDPVAARLVGALLDLIFRVALGLTIVLCGVEIVRQLIRLLQRSQPIP